MDNLSVTHAFNYIVLRVNPGLTSCEDLATALPTKGQYSTTRRRQMCADSGSHIRSSLPNWSPPLASFHQSWIYMIGKRHSGKADQLTLASGGSEHAYRIASFCHEDFNVASHGIRNIKIRYIFYLVSFYHVRFCNCLVLCLYFSISLRSKWGLFQTLKQHYLMHESIRKSVVSAIGI